MNLLKYAFYSLLVYSINYNLEIGLDIAKQMLALLFIVSFDFMLHIIDTHVINFSLLSTPLIKEKQLNEESLKKINTVMRLYYITNYLIYLSISMAILYFLGV